MKKIKIIEDESRKPISNWWNFQKEIVEGKNYIKY